jgi:hypothetical protein
MNELAMNFATKGVDHEYLKLLIIGKPISVKAFSEGAAMRDRVSIRFEFDTDSLNGTPSTMSKKNFCIAVNLGSFCLPAIARRDAAICRR